MKPTKMLWLEGDPGKRRSYTIEPAPPQAEPTCPDWLDGIAKAEWEHVTAVLRDMGMLTAADQTMLACYCEAWSRYVVAVENVKKFGPVILSPNKKFPMMSPWRTEMRIALKDIISLSDRFGLSPSARARLAIKPNEKNDSDWGRLVS